MVKMNNDFSKYEVAIFSRSLVSYTVISLYRKTPYFRKWMSEITEFEADEVLNIKEFAFVNVCFQHKRNEEIGHYRQTLN